MDKVAAVALTAEIRQSIEDLEKLLQEFIDAQAWLAMDYGSFTAWWDAEIGESRLGGEIKAIVIDVMLLERVSVHGPFVRGRLSHKVSRFTRAEANDMIAARAEGTTAREIAERFGCSKETVFNIANGTTQHFADDVIKDKPTMSDIAKRVGSSSSTVEKRAKQFRNLTRYGNGDRYGEQTVTVGTTVTKDQCDKLDRLAARGKMTRAETVRLAVMQYLSRQDVDVDG